MSTFFSSRRDRMSWFNKARVVEESKLNPARVRRALGVLMARDGQARLARYSATVSRCSCADRRSNPSQPCKHMIARMIEYRIAETRSRSLPVLMDALQALSDRPAWSVGETLALTDRIYVRCTGFDVVVTAGEASVTFLRLSAAGWCSALADVEVVADIADLWAGRPIAVHAKLFFGTRVR